jgi:hypothetical protein
MKQLGHSILAVGLGLALVACASENPALAPVDTPEAADDASTGTGTGTAGGSSPDPSSGEGTTPSPPVKPPPSTSKGEVTFGAACDAVVPCGGTLAGTYDYTGGCMGDVFADFEELCPGIDPSGLALSVAGSLYFFGNELSRAVTTTISGTMVYPAACAELFGGCDALETALASDLGTASCTAGVAACSCELAGSKTDTSTTTFTVSGNTATTADGGSAELCVAGSELSYVGNLFDDEEGTWKLKKR